MVGATGFEPATPSPPGRRPGQLLIFFTDILGSASADLNGIDVVSPPFSPRSNGFEPTINAAYPTDLLGFGVLATLTAAATSSLAMLMYIAVVEGSACRAAFWVIE